MNKYDRIIKLLDEGSYADAYSGSALGKHDPVAKTIDKVAHSKLAKKIASSKIAKKAKEIGNKDVGALAKKAGNKFKTVAKKLFKKK